MTVIDLAEAAMERAHRMAPCREASEWVERAGHDPLVFVEGRPQSVSSLEPETFDRFMEILNRLPDWDGMSMADAVSFLAFGVSDDADMVCVYHEMLDIPKISKPIVIPDEEDGRDIALTSCELEGAA